MIRIDKKIADAYFKMRVRNIIILLSIGFLVSFGSVIFAEFLSQFTFIGGVPLSYYVSAQGSILMFIVLLFASAILSDRMDKKFGISGNSDGEVDSEKLVQGE